MTDLPYVLSNGKIPELFEALSAAARPEKFSTVFLDRLGFSSSNDRAFISLFRKLGFTNESGVPTPLYDDLRDGQKRGSILAQQMRILYSDLFAINQNINTSPDADLKAAVARVTGKDEALSTRIANTFKALAQQADFSRHISSPVAQPETAKDPPQVPHSFKNNSVQAPQFHYNIQIVLPATTEIAVYNAIFKSVKDNLGL